jgi:hypothetical protein
MRERAGTRLCHSILFDVSVCVLVACCISCGFRPGDRFLIPETYKGWVIVRYNRASQPEFPREKGRFLIEVPESGKVATRTKLIAGYATDDYYFVSPNGQRISIPVQVQGCQAGTCISHIEYYWSPQQVAIFFVGNESERSKFPWPTDSELF